MFYTASQDMQQISIEAREFQRPVEGECSVRTNRRCNPETWDEFGGYSDGCCTVDQKCGENEGDCSEDADCMPGLMCGKNNCPKDMGFGERSDCCEPVSDVFNPSNPLDFIYQLPYLYLKSSMCARAS